MFTKIRLFYELKYLNTYLKLYGYIST